MAIGSAAGLGLSHIAPGTFGALLGVLIHLGIASFFPENLHIPGLTLFFLLICVANNVLSPWAEAYWQCKDPRHFVLDEVAGYLLVPILYHGERLWSTVLWGFFLFRILDIIKIPPARQIDRKMPGGWGILLDDLVSALYAVLLMYGLRWCRTRFGLELGL